MFTPTKLAYFMLFVADLGLASALLFVDAIDRATFGLESVGLAAIMFWLHRHEQRDRTRHRIFQPYAHGWFWPHLCLPLGLATALAFPRLNELGGRVVLVSGACWFAWWGARLRYHFPVASRPRKSGLWLLLLACACLTRSPLAVAVVATLSAMALLMVGPEKQKTTHEPSA